MANSLYSPYKDALLTNADAGSNTCDWSLDQIDAMLTSASYTPNLATDAWWNDIPGVAQIAQATVSGISVTDGIVSVSGIVTFPSVTGAACTRLILLRNNGNDDTSSPLLLMFDTFTSGMPITPDGSDIILSFNAAGILQL